MQTPDSGFRNVTRTPRDDRVVYDHSPYWSVPEMRDRSPCQAAVGVTPAALTPSTLWADLLAIVAATLDPSRLAAWLQGRIPAQ
jgi:hypothetical protein